MNAFTTRRKKKWIMLILTDEEILKDIAGFEQRIKSASDKLAALPAGQLSYQEHRKREAARQVYADEIEHVQRLIGYAREAL